MKIKTHYSTNATALEAATELGAELNTLEPGLVVFFASSNYDPHQVATAMASQFPGAQTIGCTTAGELTSGKMLKNSLVAMAFSKPALPEVEVAVLENLSKNPREAVRRAFDQLETSTETNSHDFSFEDQLGFVFVDGLSRSEEALMDAIGDLTNVRFIGGSAGDDLKFDKTWVFANGKAYTNAAVLTLLTPAIGFEILKTQSFDATDHILTVTKCDEETRCIHEFNGEPAAQVYAGLLDTTAENAKEFFMHNPVGLMVQNEPFVRSPQQIKGTDMVFYCNVKEGMELRLLNARDIVTDTQRDLEEAKKGKSPISAIVNFHCILRTLELEKQNETEAYGKLFTDTPTLGFSTYGEQYVGHINQTSTMVLFR